MLIADDASAPHLKAGEYAVIDTTDRELQAGELYIIQCDSGDRRRHVVQIRSTRSGWWAGDLAGFRQTDEKIFGLPVFAGVSDIRLPPQVSTAKTCRMRANSCDTLVWH